MVYPKFGCGTIVGLSNVSFGMPERAWINSAFLAMAIGYGLTMAILNPSSDTLMSIKMASDVLKVKDRNSKKYIEHFAALKSDKPQVVEKKDTASPVEKVYDAVVKGDRENIRKYIDDALKDGTEPSIIVDKYLIPAITHVGDLYDRKEYFLPQLIQSAETMKEAFGILEPLLRKNQWTKR